MTVQEMIRSHFSFADHVIKGYCVSARVTGTKYYSGDGDERYIRQNILDLKVERWLIDNGKFFVMIVSPDEKLEKIKSKALSELLEKYVQGDNNKKSVVNV